MQLRILHISDLHAGASVSPPDWRRTDVLGDAWRRNLETIKGDGPIHLVCFTGDIAYSGKHFEYQQARALIVDWLDVLDLDPSRLFVVPGNHDVDRESNAAQYAALRTVVEHNTDRLVLARWMKGVGQPPRGIHESYRGAVLARQAEYQRFIVEDLGLAALAPERSAHGHLGYRVALDIAGFPPLHIIGFNTAWLSGESDSPSNLLLTDEQVMCLATNGGQPLPGLNIALMHHSLTDLGDQRDIQRSLAGRVQLVLRGHHHSYSCDSQVFVDHGRRFAELAVSSLFDSLTANRYSNGCQVVMLDTDGRQPGGSVWTRSWSSNGYWYDDNSPYPGMAGGRFSWGVSPMTMPAMFSQVSLADYLRTARRRVAREGISNGLVRPDRVYVGQTGIELGDARRTRVKLLDVIDQVWRGDRRRVMVLGNYGMGKTYLALRTVIEQIDGFREPGVARIPIYYALGGLNCGAALSNDPLRRQDVLEQIRLDLQGRDFPKLEHSEFLKLAEEGTLVFVLDGLDELNLPRGDSWHKILEPLLKISGSRCVITTRTAYVEDKERELAGWEAYEIQDWSRQEWLDYVERCGELDDSRQQQAFLERVDTLPQLRKLTSRPLWCFMIMRIRDRLESGHDLGMAGLYQEFLDDSLEQVTRAADVTNQILGTKEKYMALERFAETCAVEGRGELGAQRLEQLLCALFQEIGLTQLQNFLVREVKVYSFINCDQKDRFNFGHASFADYFVVASAARALVRSLPRPPTEKPGPAQVRAARSSFLALRSLRSEQLEFLAGILESEDVGRSLRLIDGGVAFDEYKHALDECMRNLLAGSASDELRRNVFLTYLRMKRGFAGARAAVADISLRQVRLPNEDLSNCDFSNVDFSHANLTGATFHGSTLAGCRFAQATLDAVSFDDADLAYADLSFIETPAVPPRLARARNVDNLTVDMITRKNLDNWIRAQSAAPDQSENSGTSIE